MHRQIVNIDSHYWLRISNTESLNRTHPQPTESIENAQKILKWTLDGNAEKYTDLNLTEADKEVICKLAVRWDYDELVELLKKNMSFCAYRLMLHLSIDNLANPYPQTFMIAKYGGNRTKAMIIDYVFRNPRNTGYFLSKRCRTEALWQCLDRIVPVVCNVRGKVEIEGIWINNVGEEFWVIVPSSYYGFPKRYYWHYQVTVKNDKYWCQCGYGYLRPDMTRLRPYLGVSRRTIINPIKYEQ